MKNKNKKVLLVGGTGYIGTVLYNSLKKKGYQITSIDNQIFGKKIFKKNFKTNYNKKVSFLNFKSIENDLANVDYIIFLAGLVGDPITAKYPKLSNLVNEKGSIKFLKFIGKFKIKKLLYISTCSNYGLSSSTKKLNETSILKPLSLYAKSKVNIEKYLLKNKKKLGYPFNILRFSTAFGDSPRMRFDLTINEFIFELLSGKELLVFDPDTWRPYCHVIDFARLTFEIILNCNQDLSFEIFDAGSDINNFTKRGLVNLIADKIDGSKIKFKDGDVDPRNYRVNFQKLETKLNFKTKHNVKDEINEIINFIKLNNFKEKNLFGNYKIN